MQLRRRHRALFVMTMVLMAIYLLWRVFFTLPLHDGIPNMIVGILLVVAECVTVMTTLELLWQKLHEERSRLPFPVIPHTDYPEVDVFVATHNEPVDLLFKTVNACCEMDYPDASKVHVWICDDGDRTEMAQLARDLGVGYLGLSDNKNAKAGNYNNALAHTSAPLVVTFDSDMIPRRSFLMKTIPYFSLPQFIEEDGTWRRREDEEIDEDYAIGFVQTPQSFYNPDLFQFNLHAEKHIPNEQDFFSREVNVMRNSTNSCAYTGSGTVLSRDALDEIGGFPYHTITEDYETSVRIQMAGYVTYATDEVLSQGLSVTTISSLIRQRTRWGRGIIQSLQNTHAIFSAKLPLKSRITYLNSFLYWWSFFNRLVFVLSPILFALFDFRIVDAPVETVAIVWLPSYLCYSMSMRYLSSNVRNQRWSQVVDTILMPYLIIPILLETLHIHARTFHVTEKSTDQSSSKGKTFMMLLPNLILLVLSVVALAVFVWGKYGSALLYGSIIIFWLCYNMIALTYALFFVLGRESKRKAARIDADEAVVMRDGNVSHEARTINVSDTGMAIRLGSPIFLPDDRPFDVTVTTEHYEAKLKGRLVYSTHRGNEWVAALTVEPDSQKDRAQWSQIIYDRPHSLRREMDLWNTAYDDLTRNVQTRVANERPERRAEPRISLGMEARFTNGATCTLLDFNYHYFLASDLDLHGSSDEALDLVTTSGVKLSLHQERTVAKDGSTCLLALTNLDELEKEGLLDRVMGDLVAMAAKPTPVMEGTRS